MSTPTVSCTSSLDSTAVGMELIATLLSTALWGIATSQMVKYYELYPKDKWPLKVYVAAAWTSNTLSLAFYNYYIYINTAKALSDCDIFYEYISNIGAFVWGLLFVPASLFTQGLYLYRIWTFGRESTTLITLNRALFYCVVSFVVLSMTSQTSIIVYQFVKDVSDDLNLQQPVFIGVMGSAIATDLSLTLSLVYLLLRHQIGALKGTKYIISRLVTYSLTTGTLCLTLAITGMTLAIVLPSTGYYNLFSVPLAPVYLNSLLASLNVRRRIRDVGQVNNTTFSLPAMSSGGVMDTGMDTGGASHTQNHGIPLGSIHFAPNQETEKSTNIVLVGSSNEQV